ncbi:precorrin-3B C(17)-methyltransferase [uncultured Megasphaera sp.]|uniref:precorrin-3B C(17)-methyltransferase n=1 Tax=uncultured Megasphaera sp. TaxID=165188 RepID=UPI00265977CD|nr:precorrin-3B C(17)-methyltransferase [uncultured Megasphaera sp.]
MKATIYVVGIGPGHVSGMTAEARHVLEQCRSIIGYTTYIRLIQDEFPQATYMDTGMTREVERCQLALEEARKGQDVALVSSGDAGVYGMAGVMYEVAAGCDDVNIQVVPGVTAACSGAALLGAPLVGDFCLISLSDLLTPWETIENRLDCAAAGDFVICLYNPASRKRADYLEKACNIILRHQPSHTPAGIVRNIGRAGESSEVLTLGQLRTKKLDMFSTVIIGNSQTKVIDGHMVTSRGYSL